VAKTRLHALGIQATTHNEVVAAIILAISHPQPKKLFQRSQQQTKSLDYIEAVSLVPTIQCGQACRLPGRSSCGIRLVAE
jgi:hypothetical protein